MPSSIDLSFNSSSLRRHTRAAAQQQKLAVAEEEGNAANVPRGSLARDLDYETLPCLPLPRAEPGRKCKLMEAVPSTGATPKFPSYSQDDLFLLEPISIPKAEYAVHPPPFEPPEHPSYRLGSSVLRTRVKSQEFPWSTLNFVTATCLTQGWKQWVEDFFDRGGEPLRVLERMGIKDAIWISSRLQTRKHWEDMEFLVQRWSHLTHTFITAWGEFTPTLEDVYVLLKLPCFGTANILDQEIPASVARIASELKFAASESSYYTDTLTKKRSTRSSKQTYAGWIRYFFGFVKFPNKDTEEEECVLIAGHHINNNKDLELPALIAFWLDRYVFPGPPCSSLSPGVFIFAAMLAQGMRLPLAPMYLGGLYGRLDQVQEQLKISYGRYEVNNYADINFLSLFLFERFRYYAPPPTLPRDLKEGNTTYEAPRAWAWLGSKETGARAQCSLANVIDKEAYFCFRPYIVDSHHTGFERRSRIYGSCLTERNDRANMYEGVYDFWRLCCNVGTLVGYVATDCLGGPGGAAFPSLYRPDRVARQLDWDQMPTTTDVGVIPIREAYTKLLLLDPGEGDVARPSFIPTPEYEPGVSETWLAYHASLIRSLRHAEQNRKKTPSLFGERTPPSVVYNDPYYSIVTGSKGKRAAQEDSIGDSKRQRIKTIPHGVETTPAKSGATNISNKGGTGQAAPPPSTVRAPSAQTRSGLRLKFVRQVRPPSPSSTPDKGARGSSRTSPSFEDAPCEVDTSLPLQVIIPSTTSAPSKAAPRVSIPDQLLIQPPFGAGSCALERVPNHSSGPEGQSEASGVGDSELPLDLSPSRVAQSKAHHDDIASKRSLEHPASSEDEEHQEGEFHGGMGNHKEHLETGRYDETTANKGECRKRSSAVGDAHRGGEEHIVPSTDAEEHFQGVTVSPPVDPDVEKEMSFLALPTDIIAVVGPFLTSHPDMRLDINRVLRRMAYKCLCKFLLFAGTHSLSALLSDKREDFIEFMDELIDFSFKSTWLDDMKAWMTSPSPIEKVLSKKHRVSVEITRLESEVKALKSEMESLEEQESRLQSLLDVPLLKL